MSELTVSRSLAERTEAMFRSVDPTGQLAVEWADALRSLAPLSAIAATSVWEVYNKTSSFLFESEELAQKYIGQFGASVGGGMSIVERPVHKATAPTSPKEAA